MADNFSKVIRSHSLLKFGGAVHVQPTLPSQYPWSLPIEHSGLMEPKRRSDFADFLVGAPTSFSQAGGFYYDNRRNYSGLFAQDSWRALHDLTLNYGLRWDVVQALV